MVLLCDVCPGQAVSLALSHLRCNTKVSYMQFSWMHKTLTGEICTLWLNWKQVNYHFFFFFLGQLVLIYLCVWIHRRWHCSLQRINFRARAHTHTKYIYIYLLNCPIVNEKNCRKIKLKSVFNVMEQSTLPSLSVSICLKILSVLFSGVDSSSGIFITDDTIL